MKLEQSPPNVSRKSYLAKTDASIEVIIPFIGTWSDTNITIKIKTENNLIKGVFEQKMPDGKTSSIPIEKFIHLADGSLEFSYSNRRLPYSMIQIYEVQPSSNNKVIVTSRFLAFWPKMQHMMKNQIYHMDRIK